MILLQIILLILVFLYSIVGTFIAFDIYEKLKEGGTHSADTPARMFFLFLVFLACGPLVWLWMGACIALFAIFGPIVLAIEGFSTCADYLSKKASSLFKN